MKRGPVTVFVLFAIIILVAAFIGLLPLFVKPRTENVQPATAAYAARQCVEESAFRLINE
jgi:hypothetical protein